MAMETSNYIPRLQQIYREEVVPSLIESLQLKTVIQVPKVAKVVVSMGLGEAIKEKNVIKAATNDLTLIAGQKAVVTKARKSIATFAIREGYPIGCKVTLRRVRMYEFLDRLINVVIPRIRDFRGFSRKAFDGHGNYSIGITEQIVFPEIDYDKIDKLRGMNVTITTTTDSNEKAYALLKAFNFPFKD